MKLLFLVCMGIPSQDCALNTEVSKCMKVASELNATSAQNAELVKI